MARLTRIIVRVSLVADATEKEAFKHIATKAVDIAVGEAPIRVQDVIDACQRSVAQCIDEMEGLLPAEKTPQKSTADH